MKINILIIKLTWLFCQIIKRKISISNINILIINIKHSTCCSSLTEYRKNAFIPSKKYWNIIYCISMKIFYSKSIKTELKSVSSSEFMMSL